MLKQYYHIKVDGELRSDTQMWLEFLELQSGNLSIDELFVSPIVRLFIEFKENTFCADEIDFYTDASKNKAFGMGRVFNSRWVFAKCPKNFIENEDPSIEFLKLYVVLACVIL